MVRLYVQTMVVGTMWSSSGIIITAVALLAQTPLAISNDTNGGRIVNSTLHIYNDDAYPVVFRQAMPLNASRARCAKPLPFDIVFERDVAVTLRDRTVICTDVFRPATDGKAPMLIAWSPYGKEVGGQWLDDVTGRSGVPLSNVSELQKFEAPDPAYWVAHGYAVLNPDARGSGMSAGHITYWGRQMAQDGYDEAHVEDLRKFFDYYLKNITSNGWDETPRVRMAELDPGANDTLDRTAEGWPPQGIQTRSFFLAGNGSLVNDNPASEASVSYAANGSSTSGQAQFRYQVREPTEI